MTYCMMERYDAIFAANEGENDSEEKTVIALPNLGHTVTEHNLKGFPKSKSIANKLQLLPRADHLQYNHEQLVGESCC